MAKAVQGFLSEDGTFFDNAIEAEVFEAELELRRACDPLNVDDDKLIKVIITLQSEIQRYISACISFADHGKTNEAASVQQQPTGSDEPMSDMGSGEREETVREQRKGTRTRGRRDDA